MYELDWRGFPVGLSVSLSVESMPLVRCAAQPAETYKAIHQVSWKVRDASEILVRVIGCLQVKYRKAFSSAW